VSGKKTAWVRARRGETEIQRDTAKPRMLEGNQLCRIIRHARMTPDSKAYWLAS
jgi:hypothetical protein